MPRWLIWTPVVALTLAAGVFGLRAGLHVSALTESDVINRAARDYLRGGSARMAVDCMAVPSEQKNIWLIVTCTPEVGAPAIYHATRFGKLRLGFGPDPRPEA